MLAENSQLCQEFLLEDVEGHEGVQSTYIPQKSKLTQSIEHG
jgi:hypothetical protein